MGRMTVFYGELQERRSAGRLPAVVTLDRGLLRLASGETELGEWKLHEVAITEYTASSILLRAGDSELVLFLSEHHRFLAETERFRRPEPKRRPTHPAFRKEPDETPADLRAEMSREVTSISEEIKDFLNWITSVGPPLWIALGAFVVAVVVIPQLVVGALLVGGVLALAAGALAYVDTRTAVRLPDALTPPRLVGLGGVLVVLGIVVSVVR